jgi:hypothetical protein
MTQQLTPEQFAALPASTQAFLRQQGIAPGGAPAQTTTPAVAPPAGAPAVPDLDGVPDQASRGPDFIPFDREFDFECVLDQVKYRCGERSGPNFYATITVTKASESAIAAGILDGQHRAWMWKFNPNSYGTDKDKSDASLRRYKDFVRQVYGLPEGAPGLNEKSAELLAKSMTTPSIGIRLRVISIRENEMKNKPGSYFHKLLIQPVGGAA